MADALLGALGVFMLMLGVIGLMINAPRLKRVFAIRKDIKNDDEELRGKSLLESIIEYHASLFVFSVIMLMIGTYVVFIR